MTTEQNIKDTTNSILAGNSVTPEEAKAVVSTLLAGLQAQVVMAKDLQRRLANATINEQEIEQLNRTLLSTMRSLGTVDPENKKAEQLAAIQEVRNSIDSRASFVQNATSLAKYAFKVFDIVS